MRKQGLVKFIKQVKERETLMSYWIFICTSHDTIDGYIESSEIYRQRMIDKFWGLGERTAHRKSLRKNDKVIFYVGNPSAIFAGCTVLNSSAFLRTAEHDLKYGHRKEIFHSAYAVFLDEVEIWKKPIFVPNIANELDFIKKPKIWGTYLQGGIREISLHDFNTIIQKSKDH